MVSARVMIWVGHAEFTGRRGMHIEDRKKETTREAKT
jgi:hypothetical protein